MNRSSRSKIVPSVPIVSVLIAGAVLGAAGQFLLDSQNGRRRRAIVRDKSKHLAHEGMKRGDRLARHAANKARGLVSRIKSASAAKASKARSASLTSSSAMSPFAGSASVTPKFSAPQMTPVVDQQQATIAPDPVQLIRSVRQSFNGVVTDPQAIDVFLNEGRVVLKGSVFRDEVQPLIDTVQAVPGVNGVENQLSEIDNLDSADLIDEDADDLPLDTHVMGSSVVPDVVTSAPVPDSDLRADASPGLTSNLPPELSPEREMDPWSGERSEDRRSV